jgi:hypothetical protein
MWQATWVYRFPVGARRVVAEVSLPGRRASSLCRAAARFREQRARVFCSNVAVRAGRELAAPHRWSTPTSGEH